MSELLTHEDMSILQSVPREHGPTTLDWKIADSIMCTLEDVIAERLMLESNKDALHSSVYRDLTEVITILKKARETLLLHE